MIHSYPSRSYRDPESLEDVWIPVVVIICIQEKDLGKQYTKRLLPDFLIPFTRMRLDMVVEAGRRKESGSTLEECCRIIGCNDLRTVRMHLKRLEKGAKEVALTLAERQAAAVHLHENLDVLRPLAPLERLFTLFRRQEEAQLRGGGRSLHAGELRHMLQAALWKNRHTFPTSYASRPPPIS